MFNQDNQGGNQSGVAQETIKRLAVGFARSRANLILMVAFTVVNLFLSIYGSDFYMLFSATLPTILYNAHRIFPGFVAADMGDFGIVVAFAVIFFYCICWLLSKRHRVFIVFALIFFTIDTLIFMYIVFIWFGLSDARVFIELAFHAWVMFYLITGAIAWWKLREVSDEDLSSAISAANALATDAEANAAVRQLQESQNEKKDDNNDSDNEN